MRMENREKIAWLFLDFRLVQTVCTESYGLLKVYHE